MKSLFVIGSLLFLLFITTECHNAAAQQQPDNPDDVPMEHRHMDMGPHMYLTATRPQKPGDQKQAEEVLKAARKVMNQYRDYKIALHDGFEIFLPNVPQKMYHFTNREYGLEAQSTRFNPEHPTSLLYEKEGDGYKLIGVMYTASVLSTKEEIDKRAPLSIAQWHKHVNICLPPWDKRSKVQKKDPRFGFSGSITAKDECDKAGGEFHPVIFGWMVHVYPDGKTPEEIWSVERQHDDNMQQGGHGM
jgi:hypothetical protein